VKREQLLAQVKVLQGKVDRACTEEAEVRCGGLCGVWFCCVCDAPVYVACACSSVVAS
jgi:hypothetical protein